jgi:hypothetical protein
MKRVYEIHLTDANDCVCAFWSNLDAEQMLNILTTIVPTGMHFISVNVILRDDK